MPNPDDTLRGARRDDSRAEFLSGRARRIVKRKPERPLTDPKTDPRTHVCLRVAARYLHMDARTLKARIDEGKIDAEQDGRVVNIAVADLVAYKATRGRLAS